ncbi:hypothetical protein OG883_19545 [Streptomyces sp. NBC_01142]|uniref:hypothetical protein n=1 Tax=Streptomyces sp. NBC_01142 TaxID=2975865 RepID=UPI0022562CB0|nr:hypothetical protein [Streptomyces sp. NBC_01142]MCX4822040.1 hypothetical protein [Streptomyces sp. NBC_01142]
MQRISDTPAAVRTDLPPVLAGGAFAVSGVGVALALADVESPLRAPFVLFFLFAGPAAGVAAALPRADPAARASAAAGGAVVIDLLIAQILSSLHVLTVGGGITAVSTITALLFLGALGRRIRNPELINPGDRFLKGIKRI